MSIKVVPDKDKKKPEEEEELSFEEIIKKNEENAERIKKDRMKANKGVTRSYRLKY